MADHDVIFYVGGSEVVMADHDVIFYIGGNEVIMADHDVIFYIEMKWSWLTLMYSSI